VTTRRRLAACLLACCLVALAAAGEGLAAAKPSPQELWELYPLDPTGRGEGERPATTTQRGGRPSPRGGVAGATTTKRERTGSAGATVAGQEGSEDGGTPLSFGLLLGGLMASILMLGAAALPERAIPRMGNVLVDRRLDLVLAGVFGLLVVTVVYLASFA
jgi:hypothetical protein